MMKKGGVDVGYTGKYGFRFDSRQYVRSVQQRNVYKQLMDNFLYNRQRSEGSMEVWAHLAMYCNRIPIGCSPLRTESAPNATKSAWDVLLNFAVDLGRLVIVDTFCNTYTYACIGKNCLADCDIGDKLTCSSHTPHTVKPSIHPTKFVRKSIPAASIAKKVRSIAPGDGDFLAASQCCRALLMECSGDIEKNVTDLSPCSFHFWNNTTIEALKETLADGKVYPHERWAVTYDLPSGLIFLYNGDKKRWQVKCDAQPGCFHEAIMLSSSCECHMSPADMDMCASRHIMMILGVDERRNLYDLPGEYIEVLKNAINNEPNNRYTISDTRYLVVPSTSGKICACYRNSSWREMRRLLCTESGCWSWRSIAHPKCTRCREVIGRRSVFSYSELTGMFQFATTVLRPASNFLQKTRGYSTDNIPLLVSDDYTVASHSYVLRLAYLLHARVEADLFEIARVPFDTRRVTLESGIWYKFFETMRESGLVVRSTIDWQEIEPEPTAQEERLFEYSDDVIDQLRRSGPSIYCRENDDFVYVGLREHSLTIEEIESGEVAARYHYYSKGDNSNYRLVKDGKDRTLVVPLSGDPKLTETIFMLAMQYGYEFGYSNRKPTNIWASTTDFPQNCFIRELQRAVFCMYRVSFCIEKTQVPGFHPKVFTDQIVKSISNRTVANKPPPK